MILKRLSTFKYPAYFSKEVMKVMVERMNEDEIEKLKK